MRRTRLSGSLVVCLIALAAVAPYGNTANALRRGEPKSRFEAFKSLAGEWVGHIVQDGKEGGEARVIYKVTSGGSAVTETVFPDTPHEMVTVITRDGDNIALTHYCAMGNQPHMTAPDSGDANTVAFQFKSAGNMKSLEQMHMHNVTYTFVDADTLKSTWTSYVKGKPAGTVGFMLKRKL